MAQKDFYAVLGLTSKATADEIKKAYRKLAKQYHPDANSSDPKSTERFKEISEAHNVLGDAEKRKKYDEMRSLGAFDGFTRGGRGGSQQRGGSTVNLEDFDIGGLGGLGDLFGSMFGGGAARQKSRGPEQGQSVETTLDVPFRTAVLGGKVPVEMEVSEQCATCSGSGGTPGSSAKVCAECNGRGVLSFAQGGFAVNRPCPVCLGKGQVPSEPCKTCAGRGEISSRKKVLINVPPGTDSAGKIRMKGQGGRGRNGGPAGDLVIVFNVKPDRFYTREGLDLIAKVPINIAQATLGSKINVKSIDGKKVSLRIPAGTPTGKRFRVRGLGVQKAEARGDLIVEVSVAVPDELSDEQKKAMEEFAAAGGMKY
ncbi:MAG: J domain-containing protein [Gemmatimonadaceae bacterium]|nr:J domain-containing protein [Gemmatimonadaceae bacterium]